MAPAEEPARTTFVPIAVLPRRTLKVSLRFDVQPDDDLALVDNVAGSTDKRWPTMWAQGPGSFFDNGRGLRYTW